MGSGAAAVVLAQIGLLFSVELNEKAPIGYLLLLALGVALFSLGSAGLWARRSADCSGQGQDGASAPLSPGLGAGFGGTLAVLAGAVALGILLALLAAGSIWGWTLVLWALALAAFAVPFMPRISGAGARLLAAVRERYVDLVIVLALTGLFAGLNIHNLQDWYYSAIGDEFLFFEHARHITETGITSPFSQEGVYNKHPMMSSIFQAAVMSVFGADYLGWTLSEVINAAVTIPGIYLLGHLFGGRKAAVVSASLFAFSHLIFAFSHTGYNNLSAIPVAVWSLALFVHGRRSGNPLLLYAAGLIAGLGFYTHYSGRAIMPVILLFALADGSPRRLLSLWPLALGFVLCVLPTFVLEQEQVLTRMFGQVVGGYSEVVTGSAAERILNNIEINLPAFNYNSTVHSYVYGPLMDPVSAVLAVLGIGFSLGNIRMASYRLLLVWFVVAVVITGILSPYPHVAITRLSFALPPLALMAGMLASRAGDVVQIHSGRFGTPLARSLTPALLVAVLGVVLALNLWQFWRVTPSVFPHKPEAVAVGAYRTEHCGGDAYGTVFVGRALGEGDLLYRVLSSFDPDGPLPLRLNQDGLASVPEPPDARLRCVVFLNPEAPETTSLQNDLARRYPEGRTIEFSNPSGATSVDIFALPHN